MSGWWREWWRRREQCEPSRWSGRRTIGRIAIGGWRSVGNGQPRHVHRIGWGASGRRWPTDAASPAVADRSDGPSPPRCTAGRAATSPTANGRFAGTTRSRRTARRIRCEANDSQHRLEQHRLEEAQLVRGKFGGIERIPHREVSITMSDQGTNACQHSRFLSRSDRATTNERRHLQSHVPALDTHSCRNDLVLCKNCVSLVIARSASSER